MLAIPRQERHIFCDRAGSDPSVSDMMSVAAERMAGFPGSWKKPSVCFNDRTVLVNRRHGVEDCDDGL